MTNLEKIKTTFLNALNLSEDEVFETLEYGSENWDSVAHMALIAALESEFDIMMETEDVIDLSSFNKAKEILSKYEISI